MKLTWIHTVITVWSTVLLGLASGQVHEQAPLKVTMCDLYENPALYAGRMVEFRASVIGYGNDRHLDDFSRQEACSAYMWIAMQFPQDVKPKAEFNLERDVDFEKYENALHRGLNIEATVVGRFDPVFVWRDKHRVRVGPGEGFGKKHLADGRLVLERMCDITTHYVPKR
ncbi:MAG: hypothetical protein WDO73_36260 [Ignavibacteriota bacterium]